MFEKPDYLYQEIAESIRRRIASGELAPGDQLPTVRTLAGRWSCTPGTVNRAYQLLADEGLVVSHRGKGTHVASSVLDPHLRRQESAQKSPLRWATLVNRAEQFLLEAASSGFSAGETQAALTVAISRWRTMRDLAQERAGTQELPQSTLRFSGSHDLIVENMASMMKESLPAIDLQLEFSGSLGGLMALMRGEADVAGVHLWDEQTDSYNRPFVERMLGHGQARLVTLAHRRLGLIMKADTVENVSALADLAKPGVRFVNRQRGSGTRIWLDAQLRRLQVDGASIEGYEDELTTHMAVAEKVASGQADVGLGIYAAAAALGLHFQPLTRERYDLVFMWSAEYQAKIEALVAMVSSEALRRSIEALGGYDASHTGEAWPLGDEEP